MTATAIPATVGENWYVSSTEEAEKAKEAEKAQNKDRVNHDEFLTLLTAQLTHQDPLNPMDDTQFIGQMAQLQALDEQVTMTSAITGMRADQQLGAASSLIGYHVTGKDKAGNDAAGMAAEAITRDGEVFVVLENRQQIPYDNVTDVREPTLLELGLKAETATEATP